MKFRGVMVWMIGVLTKRDAVDERIPDSPKNGAVFAQNGAVFVKNGSV